MAQSEDRATPADLAPEGATAALYDADDSLELDAGAAPRDGGLDRRPGTKTRQARKNEISNRPTWTSARSPSARPPRTSKVPSLS